MTLAKSNDPLISIMIPAHKPIFFEAALRTALAQTYPNFEIVICDDSGSDEIENTVKFFAPDPKLSYTRHPNPSGIAGNYRHLLQLARGQWGVFLDDDDVLYQPALATLLHAATTQRNIVLSYAACDLADLESGEQRQVCAGTKPEILTGSQFWQNLQARPPVTVSVLFDLKVARQARIFEDSQNIKSGDWESWLRIACHGNVAYTPAVTGCHRRHTQSYSQIPDLMMDVNNAVFIDRAIEYATKTGTIPPQVLKPWRRKMLAWYFTWIFSEHIPRSNYLSLRNACLALLRIDKVVALRIFANIALLSSVILSPFPQMHKRIRQLYRRIRFGSMQYANF